MTHSNYNRGFHKAFFLSFLLVGSILTILQFPPVSGALSFGGLQQVPMGPSFSSDNNIRFVDNAPPNGTVLPTDSHLKFVDQNSNGHWDPGEPVAYDSNNDGVYESIEPIIAGTVSVGASLRLDPLIKFVDTNGDGVWDQGEPVIYDSSNSNVYKFGDPMIAGTPLVPGTTIVYDNHVKFVGAGTTWVTGNQVVYDSIGQGFFNATFDPHLTFVDANGNGHWDPGETVIQDVNLTRVYSTGDRILAGPTPVVGTILKVDQKIKFVDPARNGIWVAGDAVVYDSNGNSVYDLGEPVIVPASPPAGSILSTDAKIKFVDTNGTGTWQLGKPVVYDSIGSGYYNATIDPHIKYFDINNTGPYHFGDPVIYDKMGTGTYVLGDTVISGPTPPNDGTATLTVDHHFHFVDSNLSGHWSNGVTLIYDNDSDHIFVTSDLVIVGTAPANGTLLMEPVIAGNRPAIGTPLKTDAKIRYLETDGNIVWNPGEAVVYDTNADNIYETGETVIIGALPSVGTSLREPVIVGAVPAFGSSLKTDSKIKIVDLAGIGLWVPGDPVVYDSNGNNHYDQGEPVLSGGAPGDGHWHNGETVTYDSNTNSVYYAGDTVIFGTAPLNRTSVRNDPLIKYVENGLDNHWDPGEQIAYDTNGNNVYDSGDIPISGNAPPPGLFLSPATALDYLGRTWLVWNEKPVGTSLNPVIYFKMWNGTTWSNRQAITNGLSSDNQNFVLPLINRTMMILWSSTRTGHPQIFYQLYTVGSGNPTPTIGPVQLTSNSTMSDKLESAVQDRNGRIWVAWTRQNSQSTISQIYYKYFNGTAWSLDFALPPASISNLSQRSPYIAQTKDGKIRVFWSSNDTSSLNLYYTTTNGTVTTLPMTGIPSGSWTAKTALPFASSGDDDDHASFVQSRDGVYWLFFQRSILSPPAEYIFYASSADGVSWPSSATQLSTVEDTSPAAVQSSDHKIWVFWNSLVSSSVNIVFKTSDVIFPIADLGVRAISSPSLARSGYPLNITTVITNFGDFQETSQLTLRVNNTILNTWNLNLSATQTVSLFYNWTNPSPWGRYTVTSTLTSITPAENIINQGDDSLSGPLRLSPPGDVNGDGRVNILDLAAIAFCFNQNVQPTGPCNKYADPDHSGKIDILDLALAAFYFGKGV